MKRMYAVIFGHTRIATVVSVFAILFGVTGCGDSAAYKAGYDNGRNFAQRLSAIAYETGESAKAMVEEAASGLDPETLEATAGVKVPYPKGSSGRKEWLRGYREGMKAGTRD